MPRLPRREFSGGLACPGAARGLCDEEIRQAAAKVRQVGGHGFDHLRAGLLDEQVHYELVTYEGFAPHQVPVIVECLTDNKNRTATTIRQLFRKGQLGNSGSVSWDFSHVGIVDATAAEAAKTDPEEVAIETGAQDFEPDGDGGFRFYTEPTDLDAVSKALSGMGWTVATIKLGWKAKNPTKIDDAAARAEVEQFLGELDEDDDVQNIYVGLE